MTDEILFLIARLRTHALCISPEFCADMREQAARTLEQIDAGSFQLSCGCAWFQHQKVVFCPLHADDQ